MDFLCFGLWKRRRNRAICVFLSKTQILQKSLFSLRKITIFLVRSLQKSTKIGCSNALKNNVEKKAWKIEFGIPFGLPKSFKIGPKSDVKRSSFRDAMGLTRKSSGPRACKASKWLCIWLGLLDLPLVALIIKARSSTWNASHMSLQMRCGTQENKLWRLKNHSKSSSERLKIHPKSSSKAIVLQRTPSNIIFFEYLRCFDDFWIPKCT